MLRIFKTPVGHSQRFFFSKKALEPMATLLPMSQERKVTFEAFLK